MVKSIKEVGPNRFRETFGRYYEDFEVGHIYEHRPGKTVTEYENHMFTLMTMNTALTRWRFSSVCQSLIVRKKPLPISAWIK